VIRFEKAFLLHIAKGRVQQRLSREQIYLEVLQADVHRLFILQTRALSSVVLQLRVRQLRRLQLGILQAKVHRLFILQARALSFVVLQLRVRQLRRLQLGIL
jgi:hypothetical protein